MKSAKLPRLQPHLHKVRDQATEFKCWLFVQRCTALTNYIPRWPVTSRCHGSLAGKICIRLSAKWHSRGQPGGRGIYYSRFPRVSYFVFFISLMSDLLWKNLPSSKALYDSYKELEQPNRQYVWHLFNSLIWDIRSLGCLASWARQYIGPIRSVGPHF